MFSSNERFSQIAVKASPLIGPFLTPEAWQEVKFVYQLESFCWFEVRAHVENGLLLIFSLYTQVSRKVISLSENSAVNYMVR